MIIINHVIETYENYREEDRLTTNNSRRIEFLTTIKVFEETLPENAKILDCAAGTGIYSFYLSDKGYNVTAADITPRHIEYINSKSKEKNISLNAMVLDATDLSLFDDESFDVVLNMGVLYHLVSEEMRAKSLKECYRVLKKGGILCSSYISRYFIFPFIALRDASYRNIDFAKQIINTGRVNHDDKNCFWTDSYYATPDEMEKAFEEQGLTVIDHFAQDGNSPLLREHIDSLSDEDFTVWFDYHYSVCREPSIIGSSNHIMIIGRK